MRARAAIRIRGIPALVLAAVLVAGGCSALSPGSGEASSPTTSATGSASEPPSAPASAPSGGSAADLEAAKKAADIADCPTRHPEPSKVDGGLPDVTLGCLGGGHRVPLAGLRGPMVINIWAQWCGPCRQEAPHLAAVAKSAGDKVKFIGIDYDDPDPLAAIEYAGRAGWHYPQLKDRQKLIKPGLQILGPPQTLFVDADGRIAYRHNGPFTSNAELKKAITDHLGVRW
jgi:thiol-disulfide isomerase/thioredoxin